MARRRLWIGIPIAMALLAVTGLAIERSVSVRTSWRVLPYQTLRIDGVADDVSVVAFDIPTPTALDISRGMTEVEHAVRLHVVSNSPWQIQVHVSDTGYVASPDVQMRHHGGSYFDLSSEPVILARGRNGVFEVSIDYRLRLSPDGALLSPPPKQVVYTIVSE